MTASDNVWMCLVCGFRITESSDQTDHSATTVRWDDLPLDWICPDCGARKCDFEIVVD